MRIVIDLQGAQGGNRRRGIGRYTLSLCQAIVRNRGRHEVFLVLNGLFADTIQPIRDAFRGTLPPECIRVWEAPSHRSLFDGSGDATRRAVEFVREAALASLDPSVVLVSSLFEGLHDNAVTSIGTLGQSVPTAVILYDLIPLLHRDMYLSDPMAERWYENKLTHLRRADAILAISESARREGIDHLGVHPDDIVNVSTAADAQFRPLTVAPERSASLLAAHRIDRPFVLYTGGIDPRKNVEGLIRAFARLPASLRQEHRLAVVCDVDARSADRLHALGREHGLSRDDLVFTGYVPDADLVALYNLCSVFVFPSLHEGFGLPALEALSCGSAVIASNTSSLPEVVGCEEALFDPHDEASLARKLQQVLQDDDFRRALEQRSLVQAGRFSWDRCAGTAIAMLERLADRHAAPGLARAARPVRRPRLAYVSPLPPERSGISDYSAEVLPELARHYDIEVIVAQDSVSTPWVLGNCAVRDAEWFLANAHTFDRVMYHFGNSSFHTHMFALLERHPGVVVLHDFFLSGVVAHMDCTGVAPHFWAESLYESHGYHAVRHRFHATDTADTVWSFPCNLPVLRDADGVICHSSGAQRLARIWYGPGADTRLTLVPLPRKPANPAPVDRAAARQALKLDAATFVVCSFGMLGPTKLNHRLLDAWLASALARDERCVLVFVGQNPDDAHGRRLLDTIRTSACAQRIRITGWVDAQAFRDHLLAADVAVQLRTLSRGEASAAVLDCMNHGVATIVNAHDQFAELPDDTVLKIPDEFEDAQLCAALETLRRDADDRVGLGQRAQAWVQAHHAPQTCAAHYHAAIERFHARAMSTTTGLIRAVRRALPGRDASTAYADIALAADRSMQPALHQRQILVDVSELVQRDAGSGIQRVVRQIVCEWLLAPPPHVRIEPVYATSSEPGYRYARRFTLGFLDCPTDAATDDPISCRAGDIFLGLDLQPDIVPAQRETLRWMRRVGARVEFVVYDLLLIHLAHRFPAEGRKKLEDWLEIVAESDGAICISRAVRDELLDWLAQHAPARGTPFDARWFHLGADYGQGKTTKGVPGTASAALKSMRRQPTFLMVGTVEPRKGHTQVMDAFEALWSSGVDVGLTIVGKQGWMVETLSERLRRHPEHGHRLHWLEHISDEYLEQVYPACACLIAASEGEGFGLPLIEAAQHALPILARDIPVFREVAGEHAHYFSGVTPEALADAVRRWLKDWQAGTHPRSEGIEWLTWQESAKALLAQLLERRG